MDGLVIRMEIYMYKRCIYTLVGGNYSRTKGPMKIKLTIILVFLTRVVFGQLEFGTYKISSDTFHILTGRNFSELVIDSNKTFTYRYLTSVSCFLWYDSHGTWEAKNDQLILTDTIISFHPIVDFVRNNDTDNDKISITIKSKENKPMNGVEIKYQFKNETSTLTGTTNVDGNFTIDTRNKRNIKGSERNIIDDVEIWIVHVNKEGQDWTTNNFSTLSAEIECVIDDNAVDEEVIRTTTYKIEENNLVYQSQTYNQDNVRPGRYLYGNFRFVKE